MRIKHFAGYGSVTARKVKDKNCTLHIHVEGNHEWGICREDTYDIFHWLVKRFDKSVTDYRNWRLNLTRFTVIPGTETCDYIMDY